MTVLVGLKEDPGGSKASKPLLLLLLPPLPSITLRQLSVERLEPKAQVVPSPLSKRSYRREHCEKPAHTRNSILSTSVTEENPSSLPPAERERTATHSG